MILSALNNLYERTVGTEGGPPPTGYAEVPVVGALDIGEAGELLQLQDLRREVSVGNKTRLLPARHPPLAFRHPAAHDTAQSESSMRQCHPWQGATQLRRWKGICICTLRRTFQELAVNQ